MNLADLKWETREPTDSWDVARPRGDTTIFRARRDMPDFGIRQGDYRFRRICNGSASGNIYTSDLFKSPRCVGPLEMQCILYWLLSTPAYEPLDLAELHK